jgi:ABC-type multidrug transport system fused ATPase/permease subunit
MVLDQGRVSEYDTPKALLSNPSSLFFALVQNWEASQAE